MLWLGRRLDAIVSVAPAEACCESLAKREQTLVARELGTHTQRHYPHAPVAALFLARFE